MSEGRRAVGRDPNEPAIVANAEGIAATPQAQKPHELARNAEVSAATPTTQNVHSLAHNAEGTAATATAQKPSELARNAEGTPATSTAQKPSELARNAEGTSATPQAQNAHELARNAEGIAATPQAQKPHELARNAEGTAATAHVQTEDARPNSHATAKAQKAHELGRKAEDFAANYLLSQGWTILARNIKNSHGELDIVALDPHSTPDELVVVEVRARSDTTTQGPLESIGSRKIRALIRSSQEYMETLGWSGFWRIDVIGITADNKKAPDNWELEHVTDVTS